MPDRLGSCTFTASQIDLRLKEAGATLLALPWAGCFPAGFRTLWPRTAAAPSPRLPVPTSREISAMDEAYRWTELIQDYDERRLVLMRSLVWPTARVGKVRHEWTWGKLRRATGLHPDTLQKRWGRGIDRIVRGLNRRGRGGTAPGPYVRRGDRGGFSRW